MWESLGNRRNAINEKTRQKASFKGLHGHCWPSVEQEMGFAMSLEIVPALILASVRGSRRSSAHVVASEGSEEPASDTTTLSADVLETPKTSETLPDSNAEILKTLVTQAKTLAPGTPVRLKEFAKKSRIGNLRAGEIFRNAESLGVIKKTTIGYVTA